MKESEAIKICNTIIFASSLSNPQGTELNTTKEELAEAMGMAIQALEKQINGRWISVNDRLPEELEDVLVYFEYFRYGNYNCMYSTYGIGNQYEGRWHIDGYGKVNVFAWMPLPKPYKESEKNETD